MSELFKNIVRLPPPHTARSYSELTPVYTADEVAKTVASFEAELTKANELLSECWRMVGNDIDSQHGGYSTLCEHVNATVKAFADANKRIAELESYNVKLANESHEHQQRCAHAESNQEYAKMHSKEFALEQQIKAVEYCYKNIPDLSDSDYVKLKRRAEKLRKEQNDV